MAITLDAISSGRNSSGDLTVAHTTGAGDNRILVALVSCQDSNHSNTPVNSIKYAGLDLVKVRADEPADDVRTEIWYLVSPPVGTYNCVKDQAGSVGESAMGVVTLFGADPILDANNGATGSSTTPSVSLTTNVNNAWSLTIACSQGAFSAINNSQTALTSFPLTDQSFENTHAGRLDVASAGATTLSYTVGNAPWAISAVSIQPAVNTFYDQVKGVFGEFKPVLDESEGTSSANQVQGVVGEFRPVIDEAQGAAATINVDSWHPATSIPYPFENEVVAY